MERKKGVCLMQSQWMRKVTRGQYKGLVFYGMKGPG